MVDLNPLINLYFVLFFPFLSGGLSGSAEGPRIMMEEHSN